MSDPVSTPDPAAPEWDEETVERVAEVVGAALVEHGLQANDSDREMHLAIARVVLAASGAVPRERYEELDRESNDVIRDLEAHGDHWEGRAVRAEAALERERELRRDVTKELRRVAEGVRGCDDVLVDVGRVADALTALADQLDPDREQDER